MNTRQRLIRLEQRIFTGPLEGLTLQDGSMFFTADPLAHLIRFGPIARGRRVVHYDHPTGPAVDKLSASLYELADSIISGQVDFPSPASLRGDEP